MIVVRREEPADADAVRAVHAAAFGRSAEADLVDALRGPDTVGAWVVVADDRLVGHVLLSRVTVGGEPALLLAPVGIAPQVQGRGHGTAVVRAALSAATADGERLVLVLGDPAYYRRFGFVPAAEHGIVDPFGGGPGEFQALLLGGAPPSGEVRYPPAYDALR